MKSLLRAAASRPIVLLAGAVLGASLAFVFYIAVNVGGMRNDLPVEMLKRQRAAQVILEDLHDLHTKFERAARDPGPVEIEGLRQRIAQARGHLAHVMADDDHLGMTAAAEIQAQANPILDDLESWLDAGSQASRRDPATTPNAIALRAGAASEAIGLLLAEAHDEAAGTLERQVDDLQRFRRSLLPIMVQIFLLGVLFIYFALRAHRLSEATFMARSRLRDAIESLPVGFILFDKDERLVMCNQRQQAYYPGDSTDIVEGVTFHQLVETAAYSGKIRDAAGRPAEWLSSRLDLFRNPGGSFEINLSDGRILEILERRTADGGTVTITADVTQARSREAELLRIGAELREKNVQLDTAMDNMVVGLAQFDDENRLVMCNRCYLEMYDLPAELGRQGTPLSHIMEISAKLNGCDEEEARKIVETRLAIAEMRTAKEDRELLSGGRVIRRIHRPMPDGGSIAVYEDVTAHATAERAMRQAKDEAEIANRSKSEFLANVSHELRTPLNAIIGFSEIIKSEIFGRVAPPQYLEYAGDIHDSGRHLLSLINDILDLSKIESGKTEIVEEELDLADTVNASIRFLCERAEEGRVEMVNAVPRNLPWLLADPRAVKQILLNLLSNAVKFTPAEGSVKVDAAIQDDGALEVSIADTGIGMNDRGVKLALTPFGQVDSTFNRRFEGTGLGLPLTERLVSLHGGSLELRSEEGRGTLVRVVFPATRVCSGPLTIPARHAS